MEKVQAFVPLAILWLSLCGLYAICTLAIAAYRTKSMPSFDPVLALAFGGMMIWMVGQLTGDFPVLAGFLLFFSGFAAFSGLSSAGGALHKPKAKSESSAVNV